jgi:hypothetical protein
MIDILNDSSIDLNQGKQFKQYQNKITHNLEQNDLYKNMKEGFTNNDGVLTKETNKVITSNDYTSQQNDINKLRQEYQATLKQYTDLAEKISNDVNGYIKRVDPQNPYLNKLVRFSNNPICYVTNQGVVKPIGSMAILNSLKISKQVTNLTIPWLSSYGTPGTIISTTPALISGTAVKMNQTFGNEGSNIFVNQFLPAGTNASYMGCYAPSPNNDNMNFIGDKPPSTDVSIQNGNFSQPVIQNDTYKYVKTEPKVPGWNFTGSVLLNNSKAWGFPMPYPGGNQCACIQNTSNINTLLKLNAGVKYTLSFYACGRNCCTKDNPSNPINVQLYTTNNAFISQVYNITPTVNSWKKYSTTFTVPTSQSYILYFKGTSTNGDRSTAIQNIILSGAASLGNYTYDECLSTATQSGYQYFALQNVNTTTSKGYCAVSNSSPAITQYGTARVPSKMIVLWSSNTAGKPGNTALLSNKGSLQVINTSGQAIYSSPNTNITATDTNFFLTLQEDGNMVIYKGTTPSDNKGLVWSTNTAGNQQSANSRMKSMNGKYGSNWITNGSTLAPGDFVGSADGKTALVMQTDGNLVLYTYQMETNCPKMSNGKIGGGELANATYDIGLRSISGNMGKLAFIDSNSELHTYPANNKKFKNTYSTFNNMNTPNNDIKGASYGGATLESCKTACNNKTDCAGFVFDNNTKICYPKNDKMYPYGGTVSTSRGIDIHLRDTMPSTPPIGVTQNTINTNTINYGSYVMGGPIGPKYGLANMNSVQKKELEQLQVKMNMLSNQIKNYTGKFNSGTLDATKQSQKNTSGLNGYIGDINSTNTKINTISNETNGGIENILKDSDIVVLQKNYDYLFWSILASGVVLVSMNIANKQ